MNVSLFVDISLFIFGESDTPLLKNLKLTESWIIFYMHCFVKIISQMWTLINTVHYALPLVSRRCRVDFVITVWLYYNGLPQ